MGAASPSFAVLLRKDQWDGQSQIAVSALVDHGTELRFGGSIRLQRLQQTSSSSTTTSARHQTGTQQLDETLNMLALPAASSLKSVLRQAATAAPRPENEAGDGAFFLTELRV
eukprot:TRINITY_DN10572_c0_g1_i3.p2 TRINITY_DN10572_c0_g1~~TRINITY_DN10572_c0_g1_i3.p2  ORF type:complete len:113 (+),score=2.47 TRINITY_DN10572_c0_g1_i3:1401-1739(+)